MLGKLLVAVLWVLDRILQTILGALTPSVFGERPELNGNDQENDEGAPPNDNEGRIPQGEEMTDPRARFRGREPRNDGQACGTPRSESNNQSGAESHVRWSTPLEGQHPPDLEFPHSRHHVGSSYENPSPYEHR